MRFIGWFIFAIFAFSLFGEGLWLLLSVVGAVFAVGFLFASLDNRTRLFKTDENYNPEYMVRLKLDESKNPIKPAPETIGNLLEQGDEIDLPIKTPPGREEWLKSRKRPQPQQFGVSAEGAERIVADWLVYLGESGIETTQFKKDGGIDVRSTTLCVQVKNYEKQSVSSAESQAIFGVATSEGRKAAIFTSSTLSPDALKFADKVGIIAIQYDVLSATLRPLNKFGKRFLKSGMYESNPL